MEIGEVTVLLRELREGRRDAFDRLVPLVYDELRRVARGQRRRSSSETLNTTALVHEAYVKLSGQEGLDVRDRGHLLAVAACAMRQVLVDFARARMAAKRGGGEVNATLDDRIAGLDSEAETVLDVDRALHRLRAHDERLARVVECRYFAGLDEKETAEALGVSQRDWMKARAWLREALREPGGDRDGSG